VRGALLVLVAFAAGCGSAATTCDSGSCDGGIDTDSIAPTSCTIMLTGQLTGSFDCNSVVISYDIAANLGSVALGVGNPAPLAAIHVTIARPGMPTVGDWLDSDPGAQASLAAQANGMPGPLWQATRGAGPDVGNYSMTLTSADPEQFNNNQTLFVGHGSVSATLTSVTQTGATGMVGLMATF
jgi:hypothetical protein